MEPPEYEAGIGRSVHSWIKYTCTIWPKSQSTGESLHIFWRKAFSLKWLSGQHVQNGAYTGQNESKLNLPQNVLRMLLKTKSCLNPFIPFVVENERHISPPLSVHTIFLAQGTKNNVRNEEITSNSTNKNSEVNLIDIMNFSLHRFYSDAAISLRNTLWFPSLLWMLRSSTLKTRNLKLRSTQTRTWRHATDVTRNSIYRLLLYLQSHKTSVKVAYFKTRRNFCRLPRNSHSRFFQKLRPVIIPMQLTEVGTNIRTDINTYKHAVSKKASMEQTNAAVAFWNIIWKLPVSNLGRNDQHPG
jgi:hypothetical protein